MTTSIQAEQKQTFGLRFGAMVHSIKHQLKEQGLSIPEDDCKHFQMDADAICRVRIRLNLSPSVVRRLEQRLIKNISKVVKLNP
jgi:hypothetical protein